jgi:fructan beta-fructosidase
MFAEPVREVSRLRGEKHAYGARMVKPGENPLAHLRGDLFDIRAELEIAEATSFGFTLRGVPVVYDVKKQTLTCKQVTAPLSPIEGKIRLRLLVDRGSIEIFGNEGCVALSVGVIPTDANRALGLFSRGGSLGVRSLEVDELKSAWQTAP